MARNKIQNNEGLIKSANELKPCPFCGGDASFIITGDLDRCDIYERLFVVRCDDCRAEIKGDCNGNGFRTIFRIKKFGDVEYHQDDRKKAADMWNRRAANG